MAGCKKKHSKQQIANYKQYAISERCGLNRLRRAEMKEIGKNWVLKNINRIKNHVYM